MSALTEFLLARIAEDEAVAASATDEPIFSGLELFAGGYGADVIARSRVGVLAECKAKRRLVLSLSDSAILEELVDPERPAGYWAQDIVYRALALPYADHPDYREEWKP